MKKSYLFLIVLFFGCVETLFGQLTEIKYFPNKYKVGEVYLRASFGEYYKGISDRIYLIDVPKDGKYYLSALVNMQAREYFKVRLDNVNITLLEATKDGWQNISINTELFYMTSGKHEIRFVGINEMVPMVEEISFSTTVPNGIQSVPENIKAFLKKDADLKAKPVFVQPSAAQVGDITDIILPNPEGTYNHDIDVAFNYTHFSTVYLTAGNHTFTTSGSTISRSLTVFNPTNYQYSWGNVNGGPGGESGLYLIVGLAGYYNVMLRPTVNGQTGTTNIILDGNTLVSGATIGGKTYAMSSLKGGALNFFTCRLQGGDTRMLASRYFSSSARGYNDDYATAGDWNWGLASRVKKDFATDSVQYGFVCAYSPTSNNNCDIYLGNENSNVYNTNYPEFPLLKADDAIKTAPNTGVYNCIAWAGGITSQWEWPNSWSSTYNCPGGSASNVTCFDNYFANTPTSRYPGAWNYTRTGATEVNSVVDLWKLGTGFTHASVKKPGNNHPHGYDWESKPGSTTRTLHPRYALTNTSYGYGSVSNFYKPTGTYANMVVAANTFATDVDAVNAGVAVFENAQLTAKSADKLKRLVQLADKKTTANFEELYKAWQKTWEANSIYSDPEMYCKGKEFEIMTQFAKQNKAVMYLVFNKYINGDHFIGNLLWDLTRDTYSKLLDEAKNDILKNQYNEEGKFKIHGDHDNGVRYVEKILNSIDEIPVTMVDNSDIIVSVSPNPIRDMVNVQITTTEKSLVSIQLVSMQTNRSVWMQTEKEIAVGQHRFSTNINSLGLNTGDIIAIKIKVGDKQKTIKAMIAK